MEHILARVPSTVIPSCESPHRELMRHKRALVPPYHTYVLVWPCMCENIAAYRGTHLAGEEDRRGFCQTRWPTICWSWQFGPEAPARDVPFLALEGETSGGCLWHSTLHILPPPSKYWSMQLWQQLCPFLKSCKWKAMEGDYRLGLDYMHCLSLKAAALITQCQHVAQLKRRHCVAPSTDCGIINTCIKTSSFSLCMSFSCSAALPCFSAGAGDTDAHCVSYRCAPLWRGLFLNGMCQLVALGTIRLFCLWWDDEK